MKKKWIIVVASSLGFLSFVYSIRAPLLIGLARAWIVREKIEPADAIMVLGGELRTRPVEAARLYHQGYAPRILLTDMKPGWPDGAGGLVSETALAKRMLLANGVPANAIVILGDKVSSTYEEAVALRDWVRPNGPRKVIVPTEFFNTRRVSWVFRKVLKGTGAEIRVKALQPETNYTERDWWHGKDGRTEFGREIIKFIAYRLRF